MALFGRWPLFNGYLHESSTGGVLMKYFIANLFFLGPSISIILHKLFLENGTVRDNIPCNVVFIVCLWNVVDPGSVGELARVHPQLPEDSGIETA
jgi:hypothetical protein